MGTPRQLVYFILAIGIVVSVVVALVLDEWWILAVALLVHLIAFALLAGRFLRRLADEPGEPGDAPPAMQDWRTPEHEPQRR